MITLSTTTLTETVLQYLAEDIRDCTEDGRYRFRHSVEHINVADISIDRVNGDYFVTIN